MLDRLSMDLFEDGQTPCHVTGPDEVVSLEWRSLGRNEASLVPLSLGISMVSKKPPKFNGAFRVIIAFDPSLSGAVAELALLKSLPNVECLAARTPEELSEQAAKGADLLVVAAHGRATSDATTIYLDDRAVDVADAVRVCAANWVLLGACHSAAERSTELNLTLVDALLAAGACCVAGYITEVDDVVAATIHITALACLGNSHPDFETALRAGCESAVERGCDPVEVAKVRLFTRYWSRK